MSTPTPSAYGRVDKFGFPRTTAKHFKRIHGFQTGDIVKAVAPKGKTYFGRVAIRTSGSFNLSPCSKAGLKTENATIQGISYRYCHPLQRADGYNYEERGTALPPVP